MASSASTDPRFGSRSRTAGRCRRAGTRTRRVLRARARADLRAAPGSTPGPPSGSPSPALLRGAGRARSGRHRPRPDGDAARVRQRLPPPRPLGCRGRRLPRDAPVPVPRLDVRPRRLAPPRAAAEREPGFDPTGSRCCPSPVDIWGPFVFANPDPAAAPLDETLGELPALVAESGLDLDALRFHSHREWPIASNWKVAIENFLECYHCPTAHPGFSKVIDVAPDAYRLQVHPTLLEPGRPGARRPRGQREGAVHAARRRRAGAVPLPVARPRRSTSPRAPNISIERWLPAGRADDRGDRLLLRPGRPAEEIQELIAWDTQVADEDVALVESCSAASNRAWSLRAG